MLCTRLSCILEQLLLNIVVFQIRLQEIRLGLYSLKTYLLDSMHQLLSMENNEKSDALLIKSLSLLPGGGE
jgi:hypothetical protein